MTNPVTPTPRQRLLDAAADLFYRHGITAVGVDLVSKAAGVSKRTLYQQFGSKDQLAADCLAANGTAILGVYLAPDDRDLPPRDAILAAFGRLRDWSSSPDFRGCPFINTAAELTDASHPARQVARDYKLRLREYFAAQAERGHADDAQLLADQLIIAFDGAIIQALMDTARHQDAAQATAEALLNAQHVTDLDSPRAES
jgi:AcrR family transcriptional regulator